MHGKKAIIKSLQAIESKTLTPPHIRFLYLAKQIYYVVCLLEMILYVIVLGGDSEFDKFLLESAALLKETVHFPVDFHIFTFPSFSHFLASLQSG